MASKMNVAYVEKYSAEENLIAIRSDEIITAYMLESNVKVKCMVHQSSSQYGVIRSAINYVYISTIVQMPEGMKIELSAFIAVMERTVIVEKQMLILKFSKGKNPTSLKAFELLAKTLFESG